MTGQIMAQAVQEYYLARLRRLSRVHDQAIDALSTRQEAVHRVAASRRKLRRIFGHLPKRTPLDLQITGQLRRCGYRIEKLLYQSRPGLYVSANLYVPEGRGPFPGVLQPCGHSSNGKAWGEYQEFCREMVLQGYVVLIYDPISQGERAHQYHGCGEPPWPLGPCPEHNLAGNQMSMIGEFFGTWRLWDGIRSLDVLLSRAEVDRARIGVSGNSGGGTLSTYLGAMDDRITLAAPACFVTDYLSNLENELPADSEQTPPGILSAGLDMADFFIARAPRPTLLVGGKRDYFDSRGLERTYRQVKKIYRLLGAAEDALQLHVSGDSHGFFPDARRAVAGFFNHHCGIRKRAIQPAGKIESEADLFATPSGNVRDLPRARRIFDFTRDAAAKTAKNRPLIGARNLPRVLERALNLSPRRSIAHYRVLRPIRNLDALGTQFRALWLFGLETEPSFSGITAVLHQWDRGKEPRWFAHPGAAAEITLYVPHLSSWEDVKNGFAPPFRGNWLFSLDVRGIGRMAARTCNDEDFFAPTGQDFFYASHGQMLGESYLGRRTHDLLAALDLLQAQDVRRIHLVGRGLGSIPAAFAGVLHDAVNRVTLRHAPQSYDELARSEVCSWPLSSLPWNGLNLFDLPDCYRLLKRKNLRRIEPWNACMQMTPRRTNNGMIRGRKS